MTETPFTVACVQANLSTLSAAASIIQLALVKYDAQVAVTEQLLKELSVMLPPAADVERALDVFLWLNKATGQNPSAGAGFESW
jgi:hypothetical protein